MYKSERVVAARVTRCTLPATTPLSVKLRPLRPDTTSKPMDTIAMQAESFSTQCGLSLNPQI